MMSSEGIWEDLNGTLDHVWQLLSSVVCQAFQPFFLFMTWVKHYLLFLTGCYEESKWDIQPAGWTSTTKTSHNFAKTIPQPELGDLKFWITWKFLDHSWGAGTAMALPVMSDVFIVRVCVKWLSLSWLNSNMDDRACFHPSLRLSTAPVVPAELRTQPKLWRHLKAVRSAIGAPTTCSVKSLNLSWKADFFFNKYVNMSKILSWLSF